MRTITLRWLCVLLLSFVPFSLVAQQEITVDLATLDHGETQKEQASSTDNGRIVVHLINALPPPVKYRFGATRAETVQPFLPLINMTTILSGTMIDLPGFDVKDTCDDLLKQIATAVKTITEEKDIPAHRKTVLERADVAPCRAEADLLMTQMTTRTLREFSFRPDETFTLSITRDGKDGPVVRTLVVTGESKGEWRLMYGFAYRVNRDETYFTKAVDGEEGKFTILKKNDPSRVDNSDFVPTIAYAWHPRGTAGNKWGYLGFVGGLSVDLTAPVVFAGVQWTYHDNIGVFLAPAMYQRTTLDGKYKAGDTVGEALEGAQLEQKKYAPTLLFGVSFRFDKIPFVGNNNHDEKPAEDKKPPTAKPAANPPAEEEEKEVVPPAEDDGR